MWTSGSLKKKGKKVCISVGENDNISVLIIEATMYAHITELKRSLEQIFWGIMRE